MTMRHTLILVLSLLFSLAALAEDVKNVTAQQFFELIQKDEGVVLDLYNLSRGIMSWKQEGYTLVKSPNVAPSISKSYTANELSGILKANNLTLIDFHAPWCAPCKKVKPIVEQAQTDFSTGIKVLTLDIEANESIKNQYSINSIPGLVLFQNGKEVWRHTGVISKEDLYKSIELYL
jgi:thioredoxin 1